MSIGKLNVFRRKMTPNELYNTNQRINIGDNRRYAIEYTAACPNCDQNVTWRNIPPATIEIDCQCN
jgi:hypothetical protein